MSKRGSCPSCGSSDERLTTNGALAGPCTNELCPTNQGRENPGGLHGDEPSPEDVFAGRKAGSADEPTNIYVTYADESAPANVLKGIREGLRMLRGLAERSGVPLSDAEAVLRRFQEGERPAHLGDAPGAPEALRIAQAIIATARDKIGVGVGLTESDVQEIAAAHAAEDEPEAAPAFTSGPDHPMAPLQPPGLLPPGEDTEMPPSLAACKMAIALMAQHEGNGTRALIWARILAQTTGDRDWTDAARLILASLPLKDPSA